MMKDIYTQQCKFIIFETIGVRIIQPHIVRYLKLNLIFIENSAFWVRIRPETFLKFQPEPDLLCCVSYQPLIGMNAAVIVFHQIENNLIRETTAN